MKAELVFWTNAQCTSNRNCFIFIKTKQFYPHYIILTLMLSRNRCRTKLIQKATVSEMYLNVFLVYYCIPIGNSIYLLIKFFFWCYSGLTQLSDQNSFPSIFCVEFTDSNSKMTESKMNIIGNHDWNNGLLFWCPLILLGQNWYKLPKKMIHRCCYCLYSPVWLLNHVAMVTQSFIDYNPIRRNWW